MRSYGTYVEETIHKLIDAANQASAMFALVDLPDVTYEDLSRPQRAQVNEYYHEVG